MEAADILALATPVTYAAFAVTEKLWPARRFPERNGWQWIGIGFLLLITGIACAWHRTAHNVDALWRGFHQIHHAPARVDAFYGMFQHWNVRTPRWLGYVIQRPESHCVHHRKGAHYYNYADFPVWDMLFGTFRNPTNYIGECGFEEPGDRRLGAMLLFGDVNAGIYGPGSKGAKPRKPAGMDVPEEVGMA